MVDVPVPELRLIDDELGLPRQRVLVEQGLRRRRGNQRLAKIEI